jgi:hypothetical protein
MQNCGRGCAPPTVRYILINISNLNSYGPPLLGCVYTNTERHSEPAYFDNVKKFVYVGKRAILLPTTHHYQTFKLSNVLRNKLACLIIKRI